MEGKNWKYKRQQDVKYDCILRESSLEKHDNEKEEKKKRAYERKPI